MATSTARACASMARSAWHPASRAGASMPVEITRSWNDEEVERFRQSWVRFVETEMQPHDAEARKRGHVGHELWRRAGELGFLCVDIPEEWGGAGGDFRHQAVLHEEMARRALS